MKSVFDELNKEFDHKEKRIDGEPATPTEEKTVPQGANSEVEVVSGKNDDAEIVDETPKDEKRNNKAELQETTETSFDETKDNESAVETSKESNTVYDMSSKEEAEILAQLREINNNAGKTTIELRELRKLYHNEFSGRLQSMQEELGHYREIEKGRIFDDILGDISKLYTENISIVEKIEDAKVKKQLRYMFLDILQILESYGVSKQESQVGERRNTKFCQVIERISTDDPKKHDTVAASRSVGFFIENRALVKEMIDVFLYTQSEDPTETDMEK